MKPTVIILLLTGLLWFPAHGNAQTRYDFAVDGSITFGLLAISGGLELFNDQTTSESCRWCDQNSMDNSVRTSLRWTNPDRAVLFSNIAMATLGTVTVIPFLWTSDTGGKKQKLQRAGKVLLIAAEAVAASMLLSSITKRLVLRERPYVRTLPINERGEDPDHNVSFFSGHSAMAFTIGMSMATLLKMEGLVSHNWWYVINGTLVAAVAYLRIAGDKHYFSDVLTGAAIGTVMGVLVPLLHKKQSGTSRRLSLWASPSDGGGLLGFTWKY